MQWLWNKVLLKKSAKGLWIFFFYIFFFSFFSLQLEFLQKPIPRQGLDQVVYFGWKREDKERFASRNYLWSKWSFVLLRTSGSQHRAHASELSPLVCERAGVFTHALWLCQLLLESCSPGALIPWPACDKAGSAANKSPQFGQLEDRLVCTEG